MTTTSSLNLWLCVILFFFWKQGNVGHLDSTFHTEMTQAADYQAFLVSPVMCYLGTTLDRTKIIRFVFTWYWIPLVGVISVGPSPRTPTPPPLSAGRPAPPVARRCSPQSAVFPSYFISVTFFSVPASLLATAWTHKGLARVWYFSSCSSLPATAAMPSANELFRRG